MSPTIEMEWCGERNGGRVMRPLGGILFGLIETFSAVFVSWAYKDAVGMILLIAILLVLPSGLVGLWQRRR